MSWNLWHGGTKVDDHRAKQLKVITETDVDVVGLQETYGTAAEELAEALGWHHHRAGENLGIISRLPDHRPPRRPGRRLLRGDGRPDPDRPGTGGRHLDGPPRLHAVRPLRGPPSTGSRRPS